MNSEKINNYLEDKRTPKSKGKKNYKSFVLLEDGKIAEEIVSPDPMFAIFDPVTQQIEIRPTVQLNGKYVYPLDGDLVTKKVLLLPEEAEDYEDVESLRREVQAFINKYVDIHPFYEKLASYYVLLTWLFDRNTSVTYLGIFGDYGSGKTRAAQVIGVLCYKTAFVSGALTCAPIYRILEQARGTLVINEFDFDNSDMGVEMIKILNNGYEKGMHVLRVEPKSNKVEAFDAFSPKVFTYRKKKKDQAFESRLVTIQMEETRREDIPILLPIKHEQEAMQLRNKLLMFRFKNFHKKVEVDESIFLGIERRLRQTLYPLLTVIEDQEFIAKLGGFIQEYQEQQRVDRSMSWVGEYLTALITLTCQEGEITVKALTDTYNAAKEPTNHVSIKKVGYVVRNELKLKTSRLTSGEHKGQFSIKINHESIRKQCLKYGVEIPEQSSLYSPSSPQEQAQSELSEGSEDTQIVEGKILTPCYACKSRKFWRATFGSILCAVCHPPVSEKDVAEWITV